MYRISPVPESQQFFQKEMEAIAPSPKKHFNDVDGNNNNDKFLNMPEPVVHHIFSFLETIDVMRASGVSRKWRYLCNTMPVLKFDFQDFERFQLPVELCFTKVYAMYKDFINWVLMSQDKSVSIRTCRLCCLNYEDDNSVYRWLRILSQKHIQKLYLELANENEKPFALPRCLLGSDSLKVLKINLFKCKLSIPSDGGFSRLKYLTLVRTHLLDRNSFRNFISACPLLEHLSLVKCLFHGFGKILEISSGSLTSFVIRCNGKGFPSYEDLTKFELKIACTNLVYFDLSGPLLQNLYWDKIPSFLQTAIIDPKWDDDAVANEELAYHLLEILRGCSHAEILSLHTSILQLLHAAVVEPGCFSIKFHNLNFLTVSMAENRCVQSIIYLLKCAPNLQRLSVQFEESYGYKLINGSELKIPDEGIACLRCHLKMVKLFAVHGADDEFEVIRFFLKNGYVLEKMSIMWYESIDRETRKEALERVMKFPRSSHATTISFSEL